MLEVIFYAKHKYIAVKSCGLAIALVFYLCAYIWRFKIVDKLNAVEMGMKLAVKIG